MPTVKITDLQAYCQNLMERQNANSKLGIERLVKNQELQVEMRDSVAEYFGYSHFNDEIKEKVFDKAWELGHSEGYFSVAQYYEEYLDLAQDIIELSK